MGGEELIIFYPYAIITPLPARIFLGLVTEAPIEASLYTFGYGQQAYIDILYG